MATLAPSTHPLRPDGACVVRSMTPDDAPAVLECAREVFATSPHTLTQPDEFTITLDREREFLAENLRDPGLLFIGALDPADASGPAPEGRVLGLLDLRRPFPKRKVRHQRELGMCVRSSHRARGVGTALMAAAIDWARAQPDLDILTLAVYAANHAGLALYRRFRFVQYGVLPDGCKHDDNTTWDQILMVRRLRD
jgi:RimJ/RimL family protein N-acetyltransferase